MTKPSIPWKLRISLALLSAATDFTRRTDGTVNRRFFRFFDSFAKVPPRSARSVDVSDVTVDSTRDLWFRLFVPTDVPDGSKLPVVVFFHGGAFSFLSPDVTVYDAVCRRFARKTRAVVVSVNYRLSPEYRYPAAYDDGYDTLKFLDNKSFGGFPENADLSRCFLAGDSAGGNLAHHVAVRFAENKSDFNELKVIGLIAIQPFFGGEERTEAELRLRDAPLVSVERTDWHWKVFLPEGETRDHEASNVFGPRAKDISGLEGFPATLVFVGGWDPLQDWQRRYCEGLKKSGKKAYKMEYPNAVHAFYLFREVPESSLLVAQVVDFIQGNGELNK